MFKTQNAEDIQKVEAAIFVLKKELFLFKLDQKMASYLPNPKDQNEVKEIFGPFINEEDVFKLTLQVVESKPEKQRSKAENFSCAYVHESLDNPIIAAQHYLYMSRQYIDNSNPSSSVKCLKKAETLIKEKTKASDQFAMANFLEKTR